MSSQDNTMSTSGNTQNQPQNQPRQQSQHQPTPPVAERRPHHREHHGRVFVDNYEWMRDKDSPDTRAYLEAENAYTDAMTADLKPLEDAIYEEIRSRVKQTDMSVPVRSGN